MKRPNKLVAIALGTIAAGIHVDCTAAAESTVEESSPIYRLHEIRSAYLKSIGKDEPASVYMRLAQFWSNWNNWGNWGNWNNWNNWFNY